MVSTESKDPPPQGTNPDWSKARSVTVTSDSHWKTNLSGGEEGGGQVDTGRNGVDQEDKVEPQEEINNSEKEQNVILT